jgi:proline iminopeptidase
MGFQGRYVAVRGTRLYVCEIGAEDAPALLYVHGGPGMGCHEFVRWQGQALGGRLRLIAFDQRGFHHSDPIGQDEPLSEQVIVEDCEALREALGVKSWFVLGHSYGGRVALRYAARHPDSVRGVIFENPAWSMELTHRFRMPVIAAIYERHGRTREAAACRDVAARPDAFTDDAPLMKLIGGIARLGETWYLHDRSDTNFFDSAGLEPLHPTADASAAKRLRRDPLNAEDLRLLLDELAMPARLIVGEADLVTSPEQTESFVAAFGRENVAVVGKAGHFVQGEQPEIYTKLVLDFVAASSRASS